MDIIAAKRRGCRKLVTCSKLAPFSNNNRVISENPCSKEYCMGVFPSVSFLFKMSEICSLVIPSPCLNCVNNIVNSSRLLDATKANSEL